MKVLLISHMYPTPVAKNYGIFVHQQASALTGAGCRVQVVSPKAWAPFPLPVLNKKWRRMAQVPRQGEWEGIQVHYPRVKTFPRNFLQASAGKRYYAGIRETVHSIYKDFKFDLIHGHVALPDGWAAVRLAADLHVPCVVTVHGQDLQHTVRKGRACLEAVGYTFQNAAAMVMVSGKLKRLADTHFPQTRDRHVVIHNGVNLDFTYKGESPLAEIYKGKTLLLSVSNLKKSKGLDLNLKALAQLKGAYPALHYIIVGDGPEKQNLQSLAKELHVADRVEFLGGLPYNRVMEYMSLCTIFSLPSWQEGFGVVYLEAMAHGKPAIAVRGEGIDGVIEDKKSGILVEPKSAASLVQGLKLCLDNPRKAEQWGAEALRLVHAHYSWQENARKNIALYGQVLHA